MKKKMECLQHNKILNKQNLNTINKKKQIYLYMNLSIKQFHYDHTTKQNISLWLGGKQ